jgi:hypothetical protein
VAVEKIAALNPPMNRDMLWFKSLRSTDIAVTLEAMVCN